MCHNEICSSKKVFDTSDNTSVQPIPPLDQRVLSIKKMNWQEVSEVSTPISGGEHIAPSPMSSNDITPSAREPSIIPVTEAELRTDNHQPRQRARLTDSECPLLVRLCCSWGEEYLQGKERLWIRQTEEFNCTTGKSIANTRTIVMQMLKQYKTKCSKVSIVYSYILCFY